MHKYASLIPRPHSQLPVAVSYRKVSVGEYTLLVLYYIQKVGGKILIGPSICGVLVIEWVYLYTPESMA